LLFDLRAPDLSTPRGALEDIFNYSGIAEALTTTLLAPGQRSRMHVGFAPQRGMTYSGYYSTFVVRDGERFAEAEEGAQKPIVFLVNERSELPPLALALQAAGRAAVVCEGEGSDASAVRAHRLDLGEGLDALVRLSELIYEDGSGGLKADAVVAADASGADAALQAALNLVREFKVSPRQARPLPAHASPRPDEPYAEMAYPPLEYRLLAAFRIWNVIHYFLQGTDG
jgi:hypothetical protein